MVVLNKIFEKIPFLNRGHERSLKAKKNIILSLFVKGTSICITFLLVPLMIKYLDKSHYGIWVTIGSVVNWASLFDFGLGNGLRNRLAEALAKNNKKLARTFVSTTYAIVAIIIGSAFFLYLIAHFFIRWTVLFNVPASMEHELSNVMMIVVSLFSVQFIIRIIQSILLANQKPGYVDLMRMISKLLSLSLIGLLMNFTEGSLINVALVFNITPTVIMLAASLILFRKEYHEFRPSFKFVDFKYYRHLLNLGIKFFIMQIAAIVMFTTDNIIVTQLFGPSYVTTYDIAHKYFGVLTMFFSIVMTPFWSATTEAFTKNELDWIKTTVRKLLLLWLTFSAIAVLMLILANYAYVFWVGKNIKVPFGLSIAMCIYACLFNFANVFVNIINGTGKVRLQFYTAILAAVINIPLSIILAKYLHMGLSGVIVATLLSNIFGPFLAPIQYYKLIYGKAEGIWNK